MKFYTYENYGLNFNKLSPEEKIIYSKIEKLIIDYENDGTKIAGELTYEILNVLKENKNEISHIIGILS